MRGGRGRRWCGKFWRRKGRGRGSLGQLSRDREMAARGKGGKVNVNVFGCMKECMEK